MKPPPNKQTPVYISDYAMNHNSNLGWKIKSFKVTSHLNISGQSTTTPEGAKISARCKCIKTVKQTFRKTEQTRRVEKQSRLVPAKWEGAVQQDEE